MKVEVVACLPGENQKMLSFPVKPYSAKILVNNSGYMIVGSDDGTGNFTISPAAAKVIKNCRLNYSAAIFYYNSTIDFDLEYEEQTPVYSKIRKSGTIFKCRCCGAPSQIGSCSKCGHIPEDSEIEK